MAPTTSTPTLALEILIPGSFIVLQGSPGDGVMNTIDYLPARDDDVGSDEDHGSSDDVSMSMRTEVEDDDEEEQNHAYPSQPLGSFQRPTTTLGALSSFSSVATLPTTNTTRSIQTITAAQQGQRQDVWPGVVVTDLEDNEDSSTRRGGGGGDRRRIRNVNNRRRTLLLNDWERQDRERVTSERMEWREAASIMLPSNQNHLFMMDAPHFWWLTPTGKVALFRDLPTLQLSASNHDNNNIAGAATSLVLTSLLGDISPGTVVVARDIVYLDSKTLQRLPIKPLSTSSNHRDNRDHRIYPKGKDGWMVFLQVEHLGQSGYVALSCDGYPLLAPGLPSAYVQPEEWIWRVICPAGGYVREGLELNTPLLETLPYGSLVKVTCRTLNEQGLSRLRISAFVDDSRATSNSNSSRSSSSQKRLIEGWCSEGLNPLSGNRGKVLVPLPFPVPAMYTISLPEGAVVRSGVELSSPEIGKVEHNSIVAITGRAFSEHPVNQCLERLRLATGGWISLRLNRPGADLVVQSSARDTDWSFDTDNPTAYHWQHMPSCDDLSSVDSDAVSYESIASKSRQLNAQDGIAKPSSSPPPKQQQQQQRSQCLICLTEERNATIVHGETGHVVCCLVCSRILKARGDKCPVCRLEIDLVIQHFWA